MTYIDDLMGHVNVLTPDQLKALHAQTSPLGDPAAVRPSPMLQAGETINGADGSMVLETPSQSGDGSMVSGSGTRAPA